MDINERFMQRALQLANNGLGAVSPNPLVGCVIVHDNKIIGEGYHQKFGLAHAEVNAINAVENKDILPFATLYVTLEPCSHFGKTPPCADLIIKNKIQKVVVCNQDPNHLVAGRGILKLQNAGVEVKIDILKSQGEYLNRRFFTFHTKNRPYIILKWAQTSNGYLARSNYNSKWISNQQSRQIVHLWRSQEDAILVGFNTAKVDNPTLTTRFVEGKNPVRVLLDQHLKINPSNQIFQNEAKTIVINSLKNEIIDHIEYVSSDNNPKEIMHLLYQKQIQSIIIEGGSKTLNQFITANLWDEARIFKSNHFFENGINAPQIHGKLKETILIGNDSLDIIENKSN